MITIVLYPLTGSFSENKDIATDIREQQIIPALERQEEVTLDFTDVQSVTQSFVHALISDVIRRQGVAAIDKLFFKNCNDVVQKIITIVIDYMQQTGA